MRRRYPETEELWIARHRFMRLLEMYLAYETFRDGNVSIDHPDPSAVVHIRSNITHTLLVGTYSFLFSLFDPSSLRLDKVIEAARDELSPAALEAGDKAVEIWRKIEKPVVKIRNNIGFHISMKREKGVKAAGYDQFSEIDPRLPIHLIGWLRLFFRELALTHRPAEDYFAAPPAIDTAQLAAHLRDVTRAVRPPRRRRLAERGGG